MHTQHHPNEANLKAEARRYRSGKAVRGQQVSHSRALELVARRHGFADWNTAIARARALPSVGHCAAGKMVKGRYLGHPFEARVVASSRLSADETLISLDLVEEIDVSASDRFSLPRKRVSGVIGSDGASSERLSNGTPQLELFAKKEIA